MPTTELAPAVLNPASDPAERRKGIGGSDVAVLLGLSPYKKPLDLYAEKTGVWKDELAGEAAHWGTVLEPVLARQYVERHQVAVARRERDGDVLLLPDAVEIVGLEDPRLTRLLGTLIHPEHEWARGHLDGVEVVQRTQTPAAVSEFKQASDRMSQHWGEPDTDQVPLTYIVQQQWYMMLAELEVSHLFCLHGGNRGQRYILERDEGLIAMLLERAAWFWDLVQREQPPEFSTETGDTDSLLHLYPHHAAGLTIEALPDTELWQLAARLHDARSLAKHWETVKDELSDSVRAQMASAEAITFGPNARITWKNTKAKDVVDWQAAAEELMKAHHFTPIDRRDFLRRFTTNKPGTRRFLCTGLEKVFHGK
jgi:predicted phage-related endonuclease